MAKKTRETQALLKTLTFCFKSPSLTLLEILWRWLYGIPALWLIVRALGNIGDLIPLPLWQQLQVQAYNPSSASVLLAQIALIIWPALKLAILRTGVPLLLGWIVVSVAGRSLVTRRLRTLQPELVPPLTLRAVAQWLLLQFVRVSCLAFAVWLFFRIAFWAGNDAMAPGQPPNLVLYLSEVVIAGIIIFAAWGVLSYVVSVAPAVAVTDPRLGVAQALRQAARLRGVIEVNLVLGIVKLALLVLAMVFSAVPIPFESAVPVEQLHIWWAMVTLWFLATSDFFQVARWVELLRLSRAMSLDKLD